MKKLFAYLLAAALLLSGCGTSSGVSGNSPTTSNSDSFVPVMVADTDAYSIAVTNLTPDTEWGTALEVRLQNKSDRDLTFELAYATVCGLDVTPIFECEVAAGKVAREDIAFYDPVLETVAKRFTDVTLCFDVNGEQSVCRFYPYGEENAATYQRTPKEQDVIAADDSYVSATILGFDPEGFFGYAMELFLENKTTTSLYITLENVTVNGEKCDPFFGTVVAPNAGKYATVYWDLADLQALGIDSVSSISFLLTATDSGDFFSGPLTAEACTVSPAQ